MLPRCGWPALRCLGADDSAKLLSARLRYCRRRWGAATCRCAVPCGRWGPWTRWGPWPPCPPPRGGRPRARPPAPPPPPRAPPAAAALTHACAPHPPLASAARAPESATTRPSIARPSGPTRVALPAAPAASGRRHGHVSGNAQCADLPSDIMTSDHCAPAASVAQIHAAGGGGGGGGGLPGCGGRAPPHAGPPVCHARRETPWPPLYAGKGPVRPSTQRLESCKDWRTARRRLQSRRGQSEGRVVMWGRVGCRWATTWSCEHRDRGVSSSRAPTWEVPGPQAPPPRQISLM